MRKRSMDYFILIATLILVVFGLIMVFSATYYSSVTKNGDGYYYFKQQIFGAGLGIGLMLFVAFLPPEKLSALLKKVKYLLVILSAVLLALVFVPGIGVEVNGAARWIDLGFINLQPSEIAKFSIIIFVAAICAANKEKMHTFRYGILGPCIIPALMCLIILFHPNFSAIICIALLTLVMILVGGANGKHLGLIVGLGGAGGAALLFTKEYRVDRVMSFLDPWQYSSGEGYQVIQSLYAIGSGGFFGRGLGNSRQKLMYLPYGESDFIFSITVEELGFFGAILLLGVFAFLVYRIIRVAVNAPEMFGCLVCTGVATIIALQVIINVAVVTSTIPATGVSMPFISYGSSALVIFLIMIGVVLNISRQTKAKN